MIVHDDPCRIWPWQRSRAASAGRVFTGGWAAATDRDAFAPYCDRTQEVLLPMEVPGRLNASPVFDSPLGCRGGISRAEFHG